MKIGIDIVDVDRVIPRQVFSNRELEYIHGKGITADQTAAGLFAAKEAYFKALGTGMQLSQLSQIEVRHDELGAPYYSNNLNATLSISHTEKVAVAVCILT